MKKGDKGKLYHKLNQLKKRIKRSNDNKGHTSKLKMIKRMKRLIKLQTKINKRDGEQ